MINWDNEELLTMQAAADQMPHRRAGRIGTEKRPCSITTIYRWTKTGCRGVILEWIQIGGTRCTSKEALSRFFAALADVPSKRWETDDDNTPA